MLEFARTLDHFFYGYLFAMLIVALVPKYWLVTFRDRKGQGYSKIINRDVEIALDIPDLFEPDIFHLRYPEFDKTGQRIK